MSQKPFDMMVERTKVACGVPDDPALWVATYLFNSSLLSRPSGGNAPDGFGFSSFYGLVQRALESYKELTEELESNRTSRSTKEALDELTRLSEEAGLYDDEITETRLRRDDA